MPLARAFYIAALAREKALINNTVKKMDESGESFAAIIVGGFHAEHLTHALKQLGYGIVKISPRFEVDKSGEASGRQHYFDILKYKWDPNLNSLPSGGMAPHAIQKPN